MDRRTFLKLAGLSAAAAAFPAGSLEGSVISEYEALKGDHDITEALIVVGDEQKLCHVREDQYGTPRVRKAYDVSTAEPDEDGNSFSNTPESNLTPLGAHRIRAKYGDGEDLGTVFEGREAKGWKADIITERRQAKADYITTRIMWLQGLEPENRHNPSRFVYIHGTNEEGLIGTKQSHGCIRMRNKDVAELYNQVSIGTVVYITEKCSR